jgi:dephospho-CoA kinase
MARLRPEHLRLTPELRMHGLAVPIVGLTGGIATGKSSVSTVFRKAGHPVVDADALIKKIYSQAEVKEQVRALAPGSVLGEGPQAIIDFKILRERFFASPPLQQQIEALLYPRLKDAFMQDFDSLGGAGKHPYVVYDVPLLFERHLDRVVDVIVCVHSTRAQQKERLMRRDGISAELAENILSKQMDIEDKRTRSNLVISNASAPESLEAECHRVMRLLFA